MGRVKTGYPGVFYREVRRIGGKGTEKVYYIVFKKDGKLLEEKAGSQHRDAMTPARAATIRAERIEGKRKSRKELREEKRAAERAKVSRWTFDKLWEEYKARRSNLKGLVTDENRYQKHIKPAFGDKEPKDLAPLDLDRLRLGLLKNRKPGTVKNVMELLRRIVNFGVSRDFCPPLPFKLKLTRVHNIKTEDLNGEQLRALFEAIADYPDPMAGNLMKMALFTGLRRGELFRLKWTDIDTERGFIHVREPKGGPDERIPINPAAQELLRHHPRTESEYVFPGRTGGQRVDVKKALDHIKKTAGLPKDFRPLHGLRHVYASMLASSGQVDLYTLQKLLTHKSPMMTQRYAHLRDEALRRAANVASDLITQAAKGKKGDATQEQTA